MLRFVVFLCIAHFAVGQVPQTGPMSESELYANLGSLDQFAVGYGDNRGGKVERIDESEQQLPQINEVAPGEDKVFDHAFAEEQRQNRVDNTKEIHSYKKQQKVTTVTNRNLHRYLKNLLVNTIYNTNIQKINHAKLNNLLITQLQETHQPKLLVKYSRQDTVQDLGERSEQPVVSEERKDVVLPPIVEPATAEKIGYNGLPLADASAVNNAAGFFVKARSGLDDVAAGEGVAVIDSGREGVDDFRRRAYYHL